MKKVVAIGISFLLSTVYVIAQNTKEAKADTASAIATEQTVSPVTSNSLAVSSDYVVQLEHALAKKDSLELQRKALRDALSKGNDKAKDLRKQLRKVRKEVEKARESVQQLLNKQKPNPFEGIKRLNASIAQNQKQLNDLNVELDTINHQLTEANSQKSELDKVKHEVSSQLITEYKPYTEQPFSQMTLEHLSEIRAKCKPFATDQAIDSLVARIDNATGNCKVYEEIQQVLNAKFNKLNLLRMLENVQTIKALSHSQQQEIVTMKKQLLAFEDGLAAFKEFINNLNKCREGVNYSIEYFQQDKKAIYPGDLEQRINEKLLIVPYLKNNYEVFMKALKKNPNMHTDIEAEILNQ